MEKSGSIKKDLLTLTLILVLSSLGCAALFVMRYVLTEKAAHTFLSWNLFLAWIPYFIAVFAYWIQAKVEPLLLKRALVLLLALVWLLFYPNSPYIFTDFVHLTNRGIVGGNSSEWLSRNGLLWFDIILFAAFAFIGHFTGLFSIYIMHSALRALWGRLFGWLAVGIAMLLAGFGIYLGRFVRLNSWDLFLSPISVIAEISESKFSLRAVLFSLALSFFIASTYMILYIFKKASFLNSLPPENS